jgi:uncharacterized membrane protein YphA (DoxX/SURF4 family)
MERNANANNCGNGGPLMSFIRQIDATGIPLLLSRFVLGLIFLSYGINKVADPIGFLKSINNYGILPTSPVWILNGIAVILPVAEILCGLLLLAGLALRPAALIVTGMLCVFTPAVYFLGAGLVGTQPEFTSLCAVIADCGCGAGPIPICEKLMTNTGLLLLSLWAFLSKSKRFRGGLGGG